MPLFRLIIIAGMSLALLGCLSVQQSDLDSWPGQPVAALDKHPIFLTMHVVKTIAADGTEIRDYITARSSASCSSSGDFSGTLTSDQYTGFTTCMKTVAACNNFFYIKNGLVQKYVPIGTGGGRCFTDARARPDFSGATNM